MVGGIDPKWIDNKMATDAEVTQAVTSALSTKVFGNDFTYVESMDESFTTSTSVYSTKLTLTTPNLSLGNYIVMAGYKFRSATNRAMTIRLMCGNNQLKTDEPMVASGAEYSANELLGVLNQVSGVKNISIQFKVGNSLNSSSATVYMSQASLTFWRIS